MILLAGTRLARHGEAIALRTGIASGWIGLFLVAAVTSLPELFTGAASILVVGSPDLAAGDALGSCAFNLLLLAIVVMISRGAGTARADLASHRIAVGYGTAMLAIVAGAILAGARLGAWRALGLASAALVVIYLVAIRHAFQAQAVAPHASAEERPSRRVYARYAGNALLVVAAASVLPLLASDLARAYHLGEGLVGSTLLAATTSLPELVVSIAALRQGAPAIAVGNLFGSNLFDLLILAIDDLLYAKGPLFAALEVGHAWTALLVAAMSVLALAGTGEKWTPARWASWALVVALYPLASVAAHL